MVGPLLEWALVLFALTTPSVPTMATAGPPPEPPHLRSEQPESLSPDLRLAASFGNDALRWRLLRQRDSNGTIPAGALLRANRVRVENLRALARAGRTGDEALGGTWRFRGPNNIGGRTRGIVIDPRDPKRILLGSATGGVFRTSNGGESWAPVDDFLPNLSTLSMAGDPNNPDVVYVGTGETVRGIGILRSTDFGQTWSHLPATADWWSTWRIAVSPANSSRILAAVWRPDLHWGLALSTDAGATWSVVGAKDGLAYTVLFRPGRPAEAVAGVEGWVLVDGAWHWRARVQRSTDGGATWSDSTGFNPNGGRIELAYAASRPNIIYGHQNGQIWRSVDGGNTFAHHGALPTDTYQYGYNNCIWVSPTNPNFLVVGVDRPLRSRDGGKTFASISVWHDLTSDPHVDVHVLVGAPGFDGKKVRSLYLGTDGGFTVADDIFTVDRQKGWRTLNNGLASTQFYSGTGDAKSQIIVGGTQDNGTIRVTGSPTGAFMAGGDGGWASVDPVDGIMFYASVQYLGGIVRSRSGSPNWYSIGDRLPEAASPHINFIAPVLIDPNSRERMFAGGLALWRSNNARRGTPPSWTSIKPARPGNPAQVYVPPISTIGLAKGHPGTIWVAHNDGHVYRTENGLAAQPTWITVDDNAGLDQLPDSRFPEEILIDRRDPRRVFISFGGYAENSVWRTDDAGVTWRPAMGEGELSLPPAPTAALAQHPLHPDWLYAGTDVGVFVSHDFGATWSATSEGPANVIVYQLEFLRGSSTTLLAGTYGRGLWTIDIP